MQENHTKSQNIITYSIAFLLLFVVVATSFYLGDFKIGKEDETVDKDEVIQDIDETAFSESEIYYTNDPFRDACRKVDKGTDGEYVVFSNTVCLE